MAKNDSVLVGLREFFNNEEDKNYFPHMMVGLETSEEGLPIGAVIKVKASPIMTLGMVDLLHQKLDEIREEAISKLKDIEDANREESGDDAFQDAIRTMKENGLTDEDREFLDKAQDQALKCVLESDGEGLKKILDEIKSYAKKRTGIDPDSGEFNLNDFKGGF